MIHSTTKLDINNTAMRKRDPRKPIIKSHKNPPSDTGGNTHTPAMSRHLVVAQVWRNRRNPRG